MFDQLCGFGYKFDAERRFPKASLKALAAHGVLPSSTHRRIGPAPSAICSTGCVSSFEYDGEPCFSAGAWRFTAVQLGGVEALVAETREAMSETARTDPLQRLKFADAVEAMRSAHFWVRKSAELFDQQHPDAPARPGRI